MAGLRPHLPGDAGRAVLLDGARQVSGPGLLGDPPAVSNAGLQGLYLRAGHPQRPGVVGPAPEQPSGQGAPQAAVPAGGLPISQGAANAGSAQCGVYAGGTTELDLSGTGESRLVRQSGAEHPGRAEQPAGGGPPKHHRDLSGLLWHEHQRHAQGDLQELAVG